jgi:hypothetical protein
MPDAYQLPEAPPPPKPPPPPPDHPPPEELDDDDDEDQPEDEEVPDQLLEDEEYPEPELELEPDMRIGKNNIIKSSTPARIPETRGDTKIRPSANVTAANPRPQAVRLKKLELAIQADAINPKRTAIAPK